MNTIIAQFRAAHESGIASKGISIWSGFTCFVYSLFTRQKVKTEAESHSEIGWKLEALMKFLPQRPDIIRELAATIPNFPVKICDNKDWVTWEEPFSGEYLFFSAASRMGGGIDKPGTRFIMAQDLLNHPERWRLLGKDQSPQACWQSFMRCWNIRGKPYDWYGILGFAAPLGWALKWAGREMYYCSEAVYYALYNKIERISPRRLGWWAVEKDGWKVLGDGSALATSQKQPQPIQLEKQDQ